MKKIILLLICSMAPCSARMGETVDQSIARYGQPIAGSDIKHDSGVENMSFQKDGFVILGAFYKGVCLAIVFQHVNPSKATTGIVAQAEDAAPLPELTKAEALELLDQNRQDQVWTQDKDPMDGEISWTRPDGATATLIAANKILAIMMPRSVLDQPKPADSGGDAATAKKEVQGL